MLACVYGAYLIVGINCHRVALIWKYMYGCTYMEVFRFTFCIYNCGVGLKWNSYVGTLTTNCVARLVTLYMRERMYATVYVIRNKFFLSLWGRTECACIMIIINQYLHYSSPYKFLTRLCNSYPLWPCLTKVVHTDGSTSWMWEFLDGVRNSCFALESFALCGVSGATSLSLEWRVPRGTAMIWSEADHTSPHTSTFLAGVEGGFRKGKLLGRLPK